MQQQQHQKQEKRECLYHTSSIYAEYHEIWIISINTRRMREKNDKNNNWKYNVIVNCTRVNCKIFTFSSVFRPLCECVGWLVGFVCLFLIYFSLFFSRRIVCGFFISLFVYYLSIVHVCIQYVVNALVRWCSSLHTHQLESFSDGSVHFSFYFVSFPFMKWIFYLRQRVKFNERK